MSTPTRKNVMVPRYRFNPATGGEQKALLGMWSLLSLNLWKGDGAFHRRLANLRGLLLEEAPEVLCLQEVFAAPEARADAFAMLRQVLPGHAGFTAPARRKLRQLGHRGALYSSTSGLALFSRFPILQPPRTLALPDCPEDRDRIAQYATLALPQGTLRVVNLHLTHVREARGLRRRQLAFLLRTLERADPVDALVVAGDFNATLEEAALEPLRALGACFAPAGAAYDGTAGRFGAAGFSRAIDHVAITPGPWPYRGREVRWARPPNDLTSVSDHAAVWSTFEGG